MNAHWLFWPVLLPLFFGGLLLAWWQWRDSGTWPRPTLAGWLALLLGGTLLAFATAGEAELLRIWLGGERGLPRALPAVWAVYGLPCWGVALTLWPAPHGCAACRGWQRSRRWRRRCWWRAAGRC